jgi:hypothetical protein
MCSIVAIQLGHGRIPRRTPQMASLTLTKSPGGATPVASVYV